MVGTLARLRISLPLAWCVACTPIIDAASTTPPDNSNHGNATDTSLEPSRIAEQTAVWLARLSNPDLLRTQHRLRQSTIGQLWLEPHMEPVRTWAAKQVTNLPAWLSVDPWSLLDGTHSAETDIGAATDRRVTFSTVITGPAAIDLLVPQLLASSTSAATASSDPETSRLGQQRWHHFGQSIVMASPGAVLPDPASAVQVPSTSSDLLLNWDADALSQQLINTAGPTVIDELTARLIAGLIPQGWAQASVHTRGMSMQLQLDSPPSGLQPVDQNILQRLPADALAVLALGVHGADWWHQHRGRVLPWLAAQSPLGGGQPDVFAGHLSALLKGFGIADGLDGLASMIDGTVLAIISDAGITPGLTLGVPRQPTLDRVVTLALGMAGIVRPADGDWSVVVMRGEGPGGLDLAPGLFLGCDTTHWWLSSDALLLTNTLARNNENTWSTSPLGAAAKRLASTDACLIATIDSPTVLRTAIPIATVSGALPARGQLAQAVARFVTQWAGQAHSDIIIAQPTTDGGWSCHANGSLTGLLGLPMIHSGFSLSLSGIYDFRHPINPESNIQAIDELEAVPD